MRDLTADRLRASLHYDPEAGVFTRKVATGYRGCHPAGQVVGTTGKTEYVAIGLEGRKFWAHRLAWLYVHGTWPNGEIDHINGIRSDNRFCNLREVERRVNRQNLRTAKSDNRSSGLLGVERRGARYRARIQVDGRVLSLGNFPDAEGAYSAYVNAKRKLHEGCTI